MEKLNYTYVYTFLINGCNAYIIKYNVVYMDDLRFDLSLETLIL